jgi:vitamin B12 transporter
MGNQRNPRTRRAQRHRPRSVFCNASARAAGARFVARGVVALAALARPSAAQPARAVASGDAAPAEVVVRAERSLLTHARGEPTLASTLVMGETLHRAGESASDVLARVPGVQVSHAGAASDLSTASIRGSDSAQLPVYVAGIRINDDVSGSADLSTVPIWMIDRVEVFRGNAPEAADRLGMGGAIFFWPREPRAVRVGASGGAGSFGERAGWLAYEAGSARAGALVAVRRAQADNDYPFLDDGGLRFDLDEVGRRRANADFVAHEAWAIGRWQRAPGAEVALVMHGLSREQGVTGLSVVPAEQARATVRRYLAGISARLPCAVGEGCRLEARASILAARLTLSDPFLELPAQRARWLHDGGVRAEFAVRGATALSQRAELALSAVQSLEGLDLVRLENTPRSAHRASTRLAAVAAWHASERLSLHALAAGECHGTRGQGDRYGVPFSVDSGGCGTFAPSGRVGLRAVVSPEIELVANVGRSVRVPTLGELYGSSPLVDGNSLLRVEQAISSDAGLRVNLDFEAFGRLALEAFAFARFADDLVRFRRTGFSSAAPFNVASARILGVESALASELLGMLRVEATATVLDPRETTADRALDPTTNDLLPLMSRLVVSARVEPFVAPGWRALDRAGVALAYFHRSSRYDDPAGLTVLPAQHVLDVEASTSHWGSRLLGRFAIRNVLDARQLDWIGLPLPGRSLHGELELWF